MEFFSKGKAVKLRSHLDKYLVARDDRETVRQSRTVSRKATWTVERVENKSDTIRLKSCHGSYLTATDAPFLLGMTGCKVVQTAEITERCEGAVPDLRIEWVPERDGFQVRLRSWCGKYLRANGGTPPWRNSVTHDDPHSSASTRNWVLWEVQETETETLAEYLSSLSGLSSVSDEVLSELGSPVSVKSIGSPMFSSPKFSSPRFSFKREVRRELTLFTYRVLIISFLLSL